MMRYLMPSHSTTVFWLACLLVSACSSTLSPQKATYPAANATALPPAVNPTPETWDYIAIGGDFTYSQNWDQIFAGYMEKDLGITVHFADLSTHDSLTLKGWLERLQNEAELRTALGDAEVVTFDVPLEAYLNMPFALYQNQRCGGEDGENCYRQRMEQLLQDLDAFLAELTRLADPKEVVMRTVLRGSIPAYQGEGIGEGSVQEFTENQMGVLIKYLLVSDNIIRQAAESHGIPVADLPAILQPDGSQTAPAKEYMLMIGLSEAGDKAVADLLRQTGYQASPPIEPSPTVQVVRDVRYTRPVAAGAKEFKLDIYASKQAGFFPVMVFINGSNTPKDDPAYQELFIDLVAGGAVVFSVQTFEDSGGALARSDQGAGIRQDHENATCAVRYARAVAPRYGGDPHRVILIGHSGGGYTGLWITLAGDQLEGIWDALSSQGGPPRQVECLSGQEGSPLPDGFIGYNGAFVYFDQMKTEFPQLFKVLDPRSHVGSNLDIPLLIVFGDQDFSYVNLPWFKKGVDELVGMLREAGHDLEFELWPGIGHMVDSRSIPLLREAFQDILARLPRESP